MISNWIKRGAWMAMLAIAVGCGGSKHFSPGAIPIAVKLRDAVKASNTSDIAGAVDRARDLYTSGAITENDLRLFVLIQELGSGNSWDDAKKVLDEGIGQ